MGLEPEVLPRRAESDHYPVQLLWQRPVSLDRTDMWVVKQEKYRGILQEHFANRDLSGAVWEQWGALEAS
eukprot:12938214-Prorocentrum_lima.AAC.1